MVIYKEGWTIAVMLIHLAFWGERHRLMLRKWREKGGSPTPYIDNIVNDALIPVLLAVSPNQAVLLAIKTAEALDKDIEYRPEILRREIEALNEPKSLDRANHRTRHLDEIEAFLKNRAYLQR